MEKLQVMPQYLYKFTLPDDLISKSLEYVIGLEYDSGDQRIFGFDKVPELTSFIERSLEDVRLSEGIKFEYVKPCLMWANRNVPGRYSHRHMHPNSLFSGIIYLTTCDCRTWFSITNMLYPQNNRLIIICNFGGEADKEIIVK